MGQLDGMLLPAQVITYCDSWATTLKNGYSFFGTDAPGETTTLSAYFDSARKKILGDGSTQYGLGSPAFQQLAKSYIDAAVLGAGYDVYYKNLLKQIVAPLDQNILNNLPSGWKFANTATQNHPFDFFLTRLNGINASTPATPAAAGTLAAVTQSGGQMPPVSTAGNAPRVAHTLVGAFDYLESLPSAQATQVTIANNQNAYSYTIAGTVPTGVTKVRMYRGYYLGGANIYYWLQDVAVTAGAAYPTIYLLKGDQALRPDIIPPGWMQCQMVPEFAAIWGLAYASSQTSTQRQGVPTRPIMSAVAMLSPLNVAIGACNLGIGASLGDAFMGVGNALPSVMFDNATITAANTFTHTTGAIQTANLAANNAQGYAGATGLQFRLQTPLTGGTLTSVTISYHYLDAAHGQSIQSASVTSGACSGTAAGSTCAFTITAGRLILDATVTAVNCSATGGSGVVEGTPARNY